jgi:hypothetical protein
LQASSRYVKKGIALRVFPPGRTRVLSLIANGGGWFLFN